jgi:hypothetical protein
VTDGSSSRRDFLRGLVRGARGDARGGAPEASLPRGGAPDARGLSDAPVVLGPDDAERAFTVPVEQRDIARALVAAGRLLEGTDGRFVEPREIGRRLAAEPVGAATAKWLDRARAGAVPDHRRPQDAVLLMAVRAELGVGMSPAADAGVWE